MIIKADKSLNFKFVNDKADYKTRHVPISMLLQMPLISNISFTRV